MIAGYGGMVELCLVKAIICSKLLQSIPSYLYNKITEPGICIYLKTCEITTLIANHKDDKNRILKTVPLNFRRWLHRTPPAAAAASA